MESKPVKMEPESVTILLTLDEQRDRVFAKVQFADGKEKDLDVYIKGLEKLPVAGAYELGSDALTHASKVCEDCLAKAMKKALKEGFLSQFMAQPTILVERTDRGPVTYNVEEVSWGDN